MKRYAIMVRENYPGAKITELCRCNTNPHTIAEGARGHRQTFIVNGAMYSAHKYNHVEVIDLAHAMAE